MEFRFALGESRIHSKVNLITLFTHFLHADKYNLLTLES
jgi:hypothetical protein